MVGFTLLFLYSVVVYTFYRLIYNLFFHPLRDCPGPFLAKISNLLIFYHSCKGDRHIWLQRCFAKYGNKVRARPDQVLFNTPTAHSAIYSYRAPTKRSRWYDGMRRNDNDFNIITDPTPAGHARRRRAYNPAFTEASLRPAALVMAKHIDRWLDLLAPRANEEWSEKRDMAKWGSALTFDVLGELCFGRSFETKEEGENPLKVIPHEFEVYIRGQYVMMQSPLLGLILWLKPRGLDRLFTWLTPAKVQHYFDFVEESVNIRLGEERAREEAEKKGQHMPPRADIFHHLYTSTLPSSTTPSLSRVELQSESHLLVIAGTDTTSTSLAGFWFYITKYPEAYSKLCSEIRSTFSTYEEIHLGPKLTNCTYMKACILESFRMMPAVVDELPREVTEPGLTIAGTYYPAGTLVGTPFWSMNYNAETYRSPRTFRPERWIPDPEHGVSEEEVAGLKKNFWPFSKGTGDCVGQRFARAQMELVIAKTLWKLDAEFVEGGGFKWEGADVEGSDEEERKIYHVLDIHTSMKDGPFVRFKRRDMEN